VWGDITDDSLDHDGEKVDPDFAAGALTDWFQSGAPVFNQHCEFYPPAGQGVSLEMDPGVPVALRAHVTEPTAVSHVMSGVYKDFSVGWYEPEYVPDPTAPNGRMVGGWAREVSLVDAGANKNSHIKGFTVAKSRAKGLPPELYGVGGNDAQPIDRPPAVEEGDGGDRFSRALKAAMASRARKAVAAGYYYAALKRDMDPDVGGGVDRDALDDSDFLVIEGSGDDKERKFPVVTPGDVQDAASSFGRYKGPLSMAQLKKKLIAFAKRKGSAFVAKLPDSWNVKKGKAKMPEDVATKAKGGKGAVEGHGPAAKEDDALKEGEAAAPKADDLAPKEGKTKKGTAPDADAGTKQCPTCKGEGKILDGNRKCPDCNGKGKVPSDFTKADSKMAPPFKKGKEAAPKAADDGGDNDDQVDEAIDELMDGLEGVEEAQATDTAMQDGGGPGDEEVDQAVDAVGEAIGELASAQADDQEEGAPKELVAASAVETGRKARKKKGAQASNGDGNGEAAPQDDEQQADDESGEGGEQAKGGKSGKGGKMGKKKAKKPKAARPVPPDLVAAHDALCPVYDVDPERALKALSTDWFQNQYYRASDKGGAKEVAAAYAALSAAHNVAFLSPPEFGRIRSAAHKALEATYPDLSAANYELRSPDQFKRPFLPGATSDTASGGFNLPIPTMAPALDPGQFDRVTQIPNQARPSPAPGVSAADMMGKGRKRSAKRKLKLPKGARVFYTNASKDDAAQAMGMLHDHIAKHFPGLCPMSPADDHDDHDHDDDGKCMPSTGAKAADKSTMSDTDIAGLRAAQSLSKPEALPQPAGAASGTLKPASTAGVDKGKAKRSAAKADGTERRAQRQVKALKRQNRRLKARQERFMAQVKEELSKPDPRARKQRGPGSNFTPLTKARDQEDVVEGVRAEARRLKTRIHSRNSQVASDAIEEARAKLPPDLFAAVITADD
jgi:hypothetical protein